MFSQKLHYKEFTLRDAYVKYLLEKVTEFRHRNENIIYNLLMIMISSLTERIFYIKFEDKKRKTTNIVVYKVYVIVYYYVTVCDSVFAYRRMLIYLFSSLFVLRNIS